MAQIWNFWPVNVSSRCPNFRRDVDCGASYPFVRWKRRQQSPKHTAAVASWETLIAIDLIGNIQALRIAIPEMQPDEKDTTKVVTEFEISSQ